MARRQKCALIVGGSIAGLYAARLLVRQGWSVRIFERVAEDLRTRGAGIATHRETFAALDHARLKAGPDIGIAVQRRRVFAADGTIALDTARPQIMASWASIYALLCDGLEAVEMSPGTIFSRVETGPAGVTAHFADGSSAEGDVLIGADGFRSAVRRHLHPDIAPQFAGTIAWRGLTPEARLSRRTREQLFEHFCFCLPPHEQMAGYPVCEATNHSAEPKREYNFIWYRPVEAQNLDRYLTDVNGVRHEVNVPPPLVRADVVAEMKRAAERLLCPQFVDIVNKAAEPFYQPIFDLDVPVMASRRVALVGDAAFVARPHVGAGVTKALDDGMALARCLEDDDIDAGLAAFDALRVPVGRRIVERGRELGAVMRGNAPSEIERAREMMTGSATLDFLQPERV
jgi:2-polyprenyl-6-methoxyphenol hydroxylase-like FAD-dependent oxidoreductase